MDYQPISGQCASFITPKNILKTLDFLLFSGGINWEHWPKMGLQSSCFLMHHLLNTEKEWENERRKLRDQATENSYGLHQM